MTVQPNEHPHVDRNERDAVDIDTDPFHSYTDDVPFAHDVVTPMLLAGFSGAPLSACRTFHHALFDRLDGVGGFDGLIATEAVIIGPGAREQSASALDWLRKFPPPDAEAMFESHLAAGYDPTEASEHVVHTVNTHSLALASAMDTNPSLTFASAAALSEAMYHAMRATGPKSGTRHVDLLSDLALSLLAITSGVSRLDGGAQVVDTGALLDAARTASTLA